MIQENLIPVLENNIETLARTWFEEVKKSDYMKTYRSLKEEVAIKRGETLFTNLVKWLKTGASSKEIEHYFEKVGSERLNEGFPLSEVNYALYLTKKVLWSFLVWKKEVTGEMNTTDVIEFITILNNYFDLGDFYIIRGYINELFAHLDESKKFTKEELESYLTKGAIYKETVKHIREKLYGEGSGLGIIR